FNEDEPPRSNRRTKSQKSEHATSEKAIPASTTKRALPSRRLLPHILRDSVSIPARGFRFSSHTGYHDRSTDESRDPAGNGGAARSDDRTGNHAARSAQQGSDGRPGENARAVHRQYRSRLLFA